jgi:hypothetical protein
MTKLTGTSLDYAKAPGKNTTFVKTDLFPSSMKRDAEAHRPIAFCQFWKTFCPVTENSVCCGPNLKKRLDVLCTLGRERIHFTKRRFHFVLWYSRRTAYSSQIASTNSAVSTGCLNWNFSNQTLRSDTGQWKYIIGPH